MPIGDRNWDATLEDIPQATYESYLGGFGGGRGRGQNFMDYWKSMYGKQYMDYSKQLADMIRGGRSPISSWEDYLKNFNFGNEWNAMAPWSRGERPGSRGFWNVGYGSK